MDSAFTSIHRSVVLLDLVDDAWAADCLSDDGARPRGARDPCSGAALHDPARIARRARRRV
jgi:hypothetical protein